MSTSKKETRPREAGDGPLETGDVGYCCGIGEIDCLSDYSGGSGDAKLALLDFYLNADYGHKAHYIFSQAGARAKYGDTFARLIRRERIGTVKESPVAVNPGTRNPLKVWLWTPDKKALETWAEKFAKTPEAQVEEESWRDEEESWRDW